MRRRASREPQMTIRLIGPLLCSGLLALATTAGAFAAPMAKGRAAGFHITDNESQRPQNRKANRKTSTKPAIFDRWGRTDGTGRPDGRRTTSVGDPHETTGD